MGQQQLTKTSRKKLKVLLCIIQTQKENIIIQYIVLFATKWSVLVLIIINSISYG